ncbi:MAG: hypothetical protein VX473_01620 [Candidatus Thermoplasmatota archaeon]|nr:hypothetical protein [Candidatus Thermoplasmatota archaeon]
MTDDNGDSNNSDVDMAECGACRAVIPMDSTSCPDCGVSFSGVAEDDMGECGACGTLVPIDSKSCTQCGVHFVMDDLTTALSTWMKAAGMNITELFGIVDTDNDGMLSANEVKQALLERNLAFLGANELDRFLSQIDLNDDGVISFAELAAALSMPWTPPEDVVVLEPEESDDDDDDEEDSDDDDEDDDSDDDDEEEESDDDDGDDDSDDEEDDSDDDDEEEDSDDDDEEEDSDDDDEEEDSEEDDSEDDEEEDDSDDDDDEEEDSEDDDEEEDSDDDDDEEEDSVDDDDDDDESDDDLFEDESESESKPEGPAGWQRFLMRNYENAFPVLYTIVGIFVIAWIANGAIGFVDGSGGNIAFDGDAAALYDTGSGVYQNVEPGEIYPCDKSIQESACKNSLTPFAGENGSSSMPVNFYWDGIMFIVLGLLGLGGIAYLQRQIKEMRAAHRRSKGSSEDEEDDDSTDEEEDSESTDSESEDEASADDETDEQDSDDESGEEESDDDGESDEGESDEEDSGDAESEEEDGIDIGSRVGVEDEDGDWYGEVIEFDDDEDAVVVKREDDGEEYVVDWDSLFQDE